MEQLSMFGGFDPASSMLGLLSKILRERPELEDNQVELVKEYARRSGVHWIDLLPEKQKADLDQLIKSVPSLDRSIRRWRVNEDAARKGNI